MNIDETLNLAHEALSFAIYEDDEYDENCHAKVLKARTAIKEILAQPKRTWVGLTRTELIRCGVLPFGMSYQLYEAIEQALKQKNT